MEQKLNSNMENEKTNENLKLSQSFWDTEKKILRCQLYLDKNLNPVGWCKHWHKNGQIRSVYNRLNGKKQGKVQFWNEDGTRFLIQTEQAKKENHGTNIIFI